MADCAERYPELTPEIFREAMDYQAERVASHYRALLGDSGFRPELLAQHGVTR